MGCFRQIKWEKVLAVRSNKLIGIVCLHKDLILKTNENYFIMTSFDRRKTGRRNLKLFKKTTDQTQFRKNHKAKKTQY